MVFKKVLLLVTSIFAIIGTGTISVSSFNSNFVEPAFAEEEPPVNEGDSKTICYITVYKIKRYDNERVSTVFNEVVTSQQEADKAIKNAKKEIKREGAYGNEYTSETMIGLRTDCDLDLHKLDEGRLEIDLHGHTLTLSHKTSWDVRESLFIDGQNGTITSSKHQSGAFELLDKANKLTVRDTFFRDIDCRRYPLFQVKGNAKKNVIPEIEFNNCRFLKCKSSHYGGVIYTYNAGKTTFKKCEFDSCKSPYGGVLYIEKPASSELSFDTYDFRFVSATKKGGVIYFDGNYVNKNKQIVNINASFTNGNTVECEAACGGFAYINSKKVNINFNNREMFECVSKGKGGAIYINQPDVEIHNVKFRECQGSHGGAIYIDDKNVGVYDCLFYRCKATKKAGHAIFAKYDFKSSGNQFIQCDGYDRGENTNTNPIFIEESSVESVQAPSQTPIWVMGGLILAAIVGSTITICLVFKKKKKVQ